MKISNVEDRAFSAMSSPAPTYKNLDALGQTSDTLTAFEFDLKEDLGRLGSINVSANSDARIVATFAIGKISVTDPRDNRRVMLK